MQTFERETFIPLDTDQLTDEQLLIVPEVLKMASSVMAQTPELAAEAMRSYADLLRNDPDQTDADQEKIDLMWTTQLESLAGCIEIEGDVVRGVELFKSERRKQILQAQTESIVWASEIPQAPDQPIIWRDQIEKRDPKAQIHIVAAVMSGIDKGTKPKIFSTDREDQKIIKKLIRAAKLQNLDGSGFLESYPNGIYTQEDIDQVINELSKAHKKSLKHKGYTAAALLLATGSMGVLATNHDEVKTVYKYSANKSTTTSQEPITATTAPPSNQTSSTTSSPSTSEVTTTTVQIKAAAVEVKIPSTVPPVAKTNAAPAQSDNTPTTNYREFYQSQFGTAHSGVIDAPLSVIAERVAKQTGDDYNANTIADYNGFEDPDHVEMNHGFVYKDCPENGRLIRSGATKAQFAQEYGLTEDQLDTYNGGSFQAKVGFCGRIALR